MQTLACQSYTIFAGNGLMPSLAGWLEKLPYDRHFVLADIHTARYCLPALQKAFPAVVPIVVPAGESFKTLEHCAPIWEQLMAGKASRHSVLLNLGGGVVGDMGGLAASLFMRGIDFIQVPTTLLAMADASVGGKTAVNFHLHKNILGTFTQSQAVWIDLDFLQTLDRRNLAAGWVEMAKHGWIADAAHWQHIRQAMTESLIPPVNLLLESIQIKKHIVESDFKESGPRKALNLGHTFGHALESLSLERDTNPLLHGEAVAAGMLMAALASTRHGLDTRHVEELASWIKQYYGWYGLQHGDEQRLWELMQRDKKNREGVVQGVLVSAPGKVLIDIPLTKEIVHEAISNYRLLTSSM